MMLKGIAQGLATFALLAVVTTAAEAGGVYNGHIAVWHHRHAIAKTVTLPSFSNGRVLGDALLQIAPLPDNVVPDADGCYCYDVNDDRLAYVQAYYYAHRAITSYNDLLRELRLPELRHVTLKLVKNAAAPSSASVSSQHPHIKMSFTTPAFDPFTLVRAVGRLVDVTASSPTKLELEQGPRPESLREAAEAAGVASSTANILAALELGVTGPVPLTDETLDAPAAMDVDTFVRIPDLLTSRKPLLKSYAGAPRFAARYPEFSASLQRDLGDSAMEGFLSQPDEVAAAAIITQPLWQAAVRFGFRQTKLLYLRALASWSSPAANYLTLAREIVAQAQFMGPDWATFLSEEYRRRGLPVQMPLDANLK